MKNLRINNVRVHVWTKAELKVTEAQLKDGGFRLEKTTDTLEAFDGNDLILMALLGPNNTWLIRVDSSYFNYE